MTKQRRLGRTPTIVKVIFFVALLLIGAVGGLLFKFSWEEGKMQPLPTGEVVPGVYAVNNGFVNFYLVQDTGGYLMIDAGNDLEQTRSELQTLGIDPTEVFAVLLTHSDGDHVAALPLVSHAQVFLPTGELQMVDGTTRRSPMGSNRLTGSYETIDPGSTVTLSGRAIEVIATPGHTPGSVCYLLDGRYLFTGDTLSLDSQGNAALFNSFYNMDDRLQEESIRSLAASVDAAYIFTGHYGYSDSPATVFGIWE